MTYSEMFDAAMEATTQVEADRLLARLVDAVVEVRGISAEEAACSVRRDLGYYAGYHSHDTRLRVEALFNCVHPYLGAAANGQLSGDEIQRIGIAMGRQVNGESDAES